MTDCESGKLERWGRPVFFLLERYMQFETSLESQDHLKQKEWTEWRNQDTNPTTLEGLCLSSQRDICSLRVPWRSMTISNRRNEPSEGTKAQISYFVEKRILSIYQNNWAQRAPQHKLKNNGWIFTSKRTRKKHQGCPLGGIDPESGRKYYRQS